MDARKLVLGGVLLTGAIAAAFWLLRGEPDVAIGSTPPRDDAPPPAIAAGHATSDAASEAIVAPAPAAERLAAPSGPGTDARKDAILRGRCVDANGAPMAGCTISLHGWGANQKRLDAWLIDHATNPEWTDPPAVITPADGTFVFAFWPPPPWQFSLDVRAEGCGAMNGRWSKLDEGSTTELGDVVIAAGVRVTGRVVDPEGRPQAKQYVSFDQQRPRQARGNAKALMQPRWGEIAVTRDDGTFAMHGGLVPGPYQLRIQGRTIDKPAAVELSADRPLEDVTIVVKSLVDVPTITGRVVDAAGQPVASAQIEERSLQRGGMTSTRTRRDGTFELRRQDGAHEATAGLVVIAGGYESEPDPRQVPWNSKDVEFRIVRGGTLTLRVTDAHDAPVSTYSVRLIARNRLRWSSDDSRVRTQGQHENGTAVIDGVTKGDWLVLVEFPATAALDALFHPLQATANAPMRLDLRAGSELRRTLRVVASDGTPVVGTLVQLCELFGGTLDGSRMVMRRDRWMMNSGGNGAMVLSEGTTDGEGRIELHGPGDRELGLCLRGPGHVPQMQGGVHLDVAGELVVRVNRGARLVGRIVPPEALVELRRLARLGPADPFPPGYRPQLRLRSPAGKFFPDHRANENDLTSLFFADDGSVAATGLPAGPWQVEVRGHEVTESGGGSRDFRASQVVLVEGQPLSLDIDLQAILPGTVEGAVVWNGAPLVSATVTLRTETEWINIVTDAEGHFTQTCRPGDYTLLVQRPNQIAFPRMLRSSSRVLVVRGQTTRHTFAVASGTLKLTVLDDAGQPVPQVQLLMRPDADDLPPTDSSGKTTIEVTAQNATLHVLPKRLSSPEAQQKLWQEAQAAGRQDPLEPHWLTVGTVAIQQGQTHELELRLPKEWAR